MITIYKYKIYLKDDQTIEIPNGAKILKAAKHNNSYYIWALVNTEQTLVLRKIKILGTGNPTELNIYGHIFVDTIFDDYFVWHVFVQPV